MISGINVIFGCGVMFLINNYIKTNYPDKYEKYVFITIYNTIHIYSYFQIKFMQLNNKFTHFYKTIKSHPMFVELSNSCNTELFNMFNIENQEPSDFEIILNGRITQMLNIKEVFDDQKQLIGIDFEKIFDFIIYNHYNPFTKTSNKIILTNIIDVIYFAQKYFVYDKSDVNFLLSEICIEDKIIKIEFKTDSFNYYMVGNIFNDKFIRYFLKTHYSKEIMNLNIDNYKLKIVDHNVESFSIDNFDSIKINKNTVSFVNKGNIDISDIDDMDDMDISDIDDIDSIEN